MILYERFADKGYHTSVATTFGLDFDAYESIVLPRLRGAGCRNNIVIPDNRMLTHALAGASVLPRHAGRLYTVNGATARGAFHPKLFLQVGRRGGRLILGSANMTASGLAGNLELVDAITCTDEDSGEQRLIARAWEYASRFIDTGQQALIGQHEWTLRRAPWLRRATPGIGPVQLSDGTMAALLTTGENGGIGARFAALVNEPITQLIVISPYWDLSLQALSHLIERFAPARTVVLLDPEKSARAETIMLAWMPAASALSVKWPPANRPALSLSQAMIKRRNEGGNSHSVRWPAESAATIGRSGRALLIDSTVSIPSPTRTTPPISPNRTPLPRMAPSERRGEGTRALALRTESSQVRCTPVISPRRFVTAATSAGIVRQGASGTSR